MQIYISKQTVVTSYCTDETIPEQIQKDGTNLSGDNISTIEVATTSPVKKRINIKGKNHESKSTTSEYIFKVNIVS